MPEPSLRGQDGHAWTLVEAIPASPARALLFLPALGISARHYLPFAQALAARGIAAHVHEWRGHGSSCVRASRDVDWGYRELLADIEVSLAAVRSRHSGLPLALGGHSLGGQLACCMLALQPQAAQALWLVASGSPYWRAFPPPLRWALPAAYRLLPWLAHANGALPGRRIGFGGREARGVIADWSRTGLRGRYAGTGIAADLEAGLGRIAAPVQAVLLADDWLAPATSLQFLLGKLPQATATIAQLDADALGVRADHFAWMSAPQAVARTLAGVD